MGDPDSTQSTSTKENDRIDDGQPMGVDEVIASETASDVTSSIKHPEPDNPIRAPYLPLSMSRRLIVVLGWAVAGLVLTTIMLAVGFTASINRKPWVIMDTAGGYKEVGLGSAAVTRQSIERFLNLVIPNIYGALNGRAPGLDEVTGLVNQTIISQQRADLQSKSNYLEREGISQFALVTGINPETLVIDRKKNFVYVEALGTIVLAKENRSQKTDVQWRCLLYIVEPTDSLSSNTPTGKLVGNRMGLYLQQIGEQPPGTINKDSPKPTASDLQEREAERGSQQSETKNTPPIPEL